MNSKIIHTGNYPYSVGWAITNKCNLRCIHCNMNSGKEQKDELTTEECYQLLDELYDNHVQKITFFGGEPFIRKDFLKIVNYAFKKGFFINVTTNSLLLTDDIIENELYKFDLVRVSLDGVYPEEHEYIRNKKGSYKQTIENIKKMVSRGIDVGIVTCISHKNVHQIPELIELLKELKIKKWFLPLLSSAGRGSNLNDEILSPLEVKDFLINLDKLTENVPFMINLDLPYNVLLKGRNSKLVASCPAAITELAIFANGDVSPCCEIPIMGGNIREKSISDIWNNSKVFCEFRDRKLIKGKCGNCKYLMNCGGCRANAYIKYHDYLEGDDVCWN